ncbi:MAG: EAL domain-containing protein [Hyphomicrobiales bacterium]|nr:MAG: EAL domain-containing protein [Hyphomicrobiales bacterium]
MQNAFAQMIAKATKADGELDLAALGRLVSGELSALKRDQKLARVRMQSTIDSTGHAISIYDRDWRLVYCNQQFLDVYRLPKRLGRPGTTFEAILRGRVAGGSFIGDDAELYVAERIEFVERCLATTDVLTLNSGRILSITHQPLADGGWVSTHKDITEFARLQDELAHRAYSDALTGLPNRHMLQERLSECVTQSAGLGSFALLIIDLDGFKSINDTLGHAAGDHVLNEVARRIENVVGHAGMPARMGGDEFAVVMEMGATAHDAHLLALRLIKAAQEPLLVDGQPGRIAFSIGVAVAPGDGDEADQLLKNADLALYAAKKERRGSYRFFEPAMDKAMRDRRQLEQDLALALERGQFELYYQPILNLKKQVISGFEALLRWRHPEEGMISPARFIPVAEETGLIVPIGEWVLREAISEAAQWPQQLRVAINVSSVQFQRGNVVPTIMNALGSAGLPPERVEIEITESVFFENSTANLDALRQLHALGLKIALDDFGTGFSALSYLLSYPFDKIKIDGSFIRAIDDAGGAQTIVRAIAEIGHGMGIVTTAEGIETAAQLRNVHAAGYNEAQGYLIARPMPADKVRQLLAGEDDAMPFPPMQQRVAG